MPKSVLLSIKPEFAEMILNGSKRFEFRRVLFKRLDVQKVVIYASHPVKKIVGEFEVEEVLSFSTEILWQLTREGAGIKKEYFDRYFSGKATGHAIRVAKPKRYKKAQSLSATYPVHRPPQSFMYIPNRQSPLPEDQER
jgi:predicted transcriptional regulator